MPETRNPATDRPGLGSWAIFFGSVLFFVSVLFASLAVFPVYSISIGSTPFQAGLQNTMFSAAAILIRFFLGPVMDRKGSKPMMLLGAFAFATAPLLLLCGQSYLLLLAARTYQALGLAVFLPGIVTLTAEMAPPQRIGTYLGATRVFLALGLMLGPPGAFLIIDRYGYRGWFLVSSALGLLSLALLATLRTRAPLVAAGESKAWRRARQALAPPGVPFLLGGIALYAFSYSASASFAAIYFKEAAPEAEATLFFLVFGLIGVAACLGAGPLSDHLGRQKTAWPFLLLIGAGIGILYFAPLYPALALASAALIGAGVQGSNLVFAAWLIELSEPGYRATTVSIQENTIDICFASSALFFGLAAQWPGLREAFLITGLLTITLTIYLRSKMAALFRPGR